MIIIFFKTFDYYTFDYVSLFHILPDLPLKQLSGVGSNTIPILGMRKLYTALWQTQVSWFPSALILPLWVREGAAHAVLGEGLS